MLFNIFTDVETKLLLMLHQQIENKCYNTFIFCIKIKYIKYKKNNVARYRLTLTLMWHQPSVVFK